MKAYLMVIILLLALGVAYADANPPVHTLAPRTDKVVKTEAEWKTILTPEQYPVLRQKSTERACSGAYWNNHEPGIFVCAACGNPLFYSKTKFESGTGWPSFFSPVYPSSVQTVADDSFGMQRTEVLCARCGSHLGHVFDDGPAPTHKRYCMNSLALKLDKNAIPVKR